MELLERTRLGITVFDFPTVQGQRMIVVKVVAHGNFFYFLRRVWKGSLKQALISDSQLSRCFVYFYCRKYDVKGSTYERVETFFH